MEQYLKLYKTKAEYNAESNKVPVSHIIQDVDVKMYKPINYNGHEYVDMGLPSGLKWAKYNVGTNVEGGCGNYYVLGAGNKTYQQDSTQYRFYTTLPIEYDTARAVMGGDWRTPTHDEINELINNSTIMDGGTINGTKCVMLRSNINQNYLIFPLAGNYDTVHGGKFINKNKYGFYWSATPYENYGYYFYNIMTFVNNYVSDFRTQYSLTSLGCSVRGVAG